MIETARLRLRGLRLDDFEPLYAGIVQPDVHRYLGGPLSREDFWAKLMRLPGQWALDGFGVFVVADRDTDVALGQTGLARFRRDIDPPIGDTPEHSWIIGAGRGRGFGQEAAAAALEWMDRIHTPDRTMCMIHPDNAPSLRLADRLGYRPWTRTEYRGDPVVLLERARASV